jgi:hypothetical protein
MTEPEETVVNPVTNPSFSGLQDAQPLPSMSDFVDYSNANFAGATPPQGSNGIFGEAFSNVFQSYYQRAEDKALSVVSAIRANVHLSLPPDPVTHGYSVAFDKFFLRAIQSFPPPSEDSDASDPSAWYKQYQPLFESFFDKFGTSIVVEASLGGMVEVYSSFGTPLLDLGFDKAKLAANALIDFTTATGLGGHEGTHDAMYTNYTDVNAVTCIGGDPGKCNKEGLQGGAWADSTATAPQLLHYKLLAQSELLNGMDPDIKKTLEDATSMYIQGKQKQWDTVDKCPKSCNERGKCTKGGDKCECQSCFGGRMCSAPTAASCTGIIWTGGSGTAKKGNLSASIPMGGEATATTGTCGGGCNNMLGCLNPPPDSPALKCTRDHTTGALVATAVLANGAGQCKTMFGSGPCGWSCKPTAGPGVTSGCSTAPGATGFKCCFPNAISI